MVEENTSDEQKPEPGNEAESGAVAQPDGDSGDKPEADPASAE